MTTRFTALAVSAAMISLALGFATSASAQSVMSQCSTKYQAAKAANTLNNQTWGGFLAQCRADLKAQPAAATAPAAVAPKAMPVPAAAPAPAPAAVAAPKPTVVAAPAAPAAAAPAAKGRVAEQSRQKTCGLEWRTNKVALKAQTPGITWPKYWSACNTRMKAAGQ